ncbi:helix-turn-helix transcriptional regulator [Oryzomonas sagensis]|uniref:Helix-turn-helix transcriptional regulator n=1 Tax=Oryzomonas sagensis TaxID=2603857 RepID=A0ABQ6TL79_9BACT|nr:helix-turn-helix transcriptional regulator [Oryzomonas sagensis]KAB0668998.1 helix-turn-helix transcriptional regulator [Oryzomonas sagensis]
MDKKKRFKLLRVLNGYSQNDVGELLQVPRSSISIWEVGKHGPGTDAVIKLADILHVDPGYLTYGKPPISHAVWIPLVPTRSDHIKTLSKEITSLLPSFLNENLLQEVHVYQLSDLGAVFLLGANKKHLIIADRQLVDGFINGFKQTEIPINKKAKLDTTVDSFNGLMLATVFNLDSDQCRLLQNDLDIVMKQKKQLTVSVSKSQEDPRYNQVLTLLQDFWNESNETQKDALSHSLKPWLKGLKI